MIGAAFGVERLDSGASGAAHRLVRGDVDRCEAGEVTDRREGDDRRGRRAVRVGDEVAAVPLSGGVRVGVANFNGQAQVLLASGPGSAQKIKIADSSKLPSPIKPIVEIADSDLLDGYFAYGSSTGGVFVGGA